MLEGYRLLRQPGLSQRPIAVVIETDLTHATCTQPAEQGCRVLINLDPAALGATVLVCENHDHVIPVEELLRLAAVGLPNITDVRAPAHDAFVTLIHGRVEHSLGEVQAYSRIEQVSELASPRDQGTAHDLHVRLRHRLPPRLGKPFGGCAGLLYVGAVRNP